MPHLTLDQTWDLDRLFPGGSRSPEFAAFLDRLEADLAAFRQRLEQTRPPQTADAAGPWTELLTTAQDLGLRLKHAGAFTSCLTAQNVKDKPARLLDSRVDQLSAHYASVWTLLDSQILQIPDAVWRGLLETEPLRPIAYNLQERRRRAADRLPPEQEMLINSLRVDGYDAWSSLYDTIVSRIEIPFEQDGETVRLSAGQAFNKMHDADRSVRETIFARWEESWSDQAELCAAALNHLAGFRLNVYRHRGWESVLREPLEINRMEAQTLNTMWEVITAGKPRLVEYLRRKARLLGVDALSWHDVAAPVGAAGTEKVAYDQAALFITDQFRRFSPRLAEFTEQAFRQRWIEAENRPNKGPGGFCTSFPLARESRIFMTYEGFSSNVATLAHELGHAYHQHVMNDLPPLAQGYAMNVAETASTFAEMLVADAALRQTTDKQQRIVMLNDKLERCTAFFMNIHARFLFETRFYDERRQGPLSVDRLNDLMLAAQQEAYQDALAVYHPTFWASKLHFYITGVPFYNFPYTFGFLFSAGIYARALAEGPGFEQKYEALLRDTGRMRVEDLAARHLGVDLTRPEFWQSAVDLVLADVDEFLQLTE